MATISSTPLSDMELNRLTQIVNKAADAAAEVFPSFLKNRDNALLPDQFIWVLDPIDRTSSFVGKDNCAFGILIGLVYNGKPIIGCIDQPILKLRWVGGLCCDMDKARVYLKVPNYNDDAKKAYDSLAKKVGKRLFNGNCIVFGELASGFVNVVVDRAGGIVTDWEGNELLWNASTPVPEGGFKIVATAGKTIHQHVISALSQ
ncbi:hypothetical protein R3W88_002805 [Solanum pinnatisectum]|uniref:Uncharacterized protein n=1 Tax=Solanum pinnatisectum TaxID=50273 RepID=A0AAV9MN64_9SOLN|nr:hypothetical protein R3W88_002805 [Solanum pinnatisectum]